jgi:hypothetical protein
MPQSRDGRAAPLRVSVGLTVYLACATLAAGPYLVRPDEAAGLPPTAPVSFADEAGASALWPSETGADGFETRDPGEFFPVLPATSSAAFQLLNRPGSLVAPWQSLELFLPGCELLGRDAERGTEAGCAPAGFSLVDPGILFAFVGNAPPIVRAQSPDISLLPLSTGDASIENTSSILSAATGTSGRVRADYLTDFGGTDRIGVQALTQGWFGIGWDGEVNYWQRPIAGSSRVPLWTGDLNLIYNFPFHPRVKFRSGIGGAWRADRGHLLGGYNITHGLDVYLLWRFMATGDVDWGVVGGDKLFHYRAALGLTYQSFEFYSGYESYKLGDERLDGWINGVAFWY